MKDADRQDDTKTSKKLDPADCTEEFREMAVKLALESDDITACARELDIPHQWLDNWLESHRRKDERGEFGIENQALKAELAAKQKEYERLKEEVELLKIAAAHFAENRSKDNT